MPKYLDESAAEPIAEPFTHSQEAALPPSLPPHSEVAPTSSATSREGGTKLPLQRWQPDEPQFTKAIASYYGVSRKSVQEWFQKVKLACPWFGEADLKLPDGRYTPLCIDLMGDYRTSGLPLEAWKTKIWEQNPDLVAAYQAAQASQPNEPEQRSQPIAPYERSREISSLLDRRPRPQYRYLSPDNNPLVLALRERLTEQITHNTQTKQRLEQFTQATTDTQSTYETLEDLAAIQEGEAAADRLFFLREEAKQRRLEALKLATLGKPATTADSAATG